MLQLRWHQKVDTLDKFNTVPAELIQLSEVLDNDAVKKLSIDKLVKVNVIDVNMPNTTGWFALWFVQIGSKKKVANVAKKIPNTSGLVKKIDYNTKITEIENKIPRTTGFLTNAALNTKAIEIDNKILDITDLLTKTALNKKDTDTEQKHQTEMANFFTKNRENVIIKDVKSNEQAENLSYWFRFFVGKNYIDNDESQKCFHFNN